MVFCDKCGTLITELYDFNNGIYKCHRCAYTFPLTNTILYDVDYENFESELLSLFIYSSSRDQTNTIVKETCPNCKNPYLTKIRIVDEKTVYTCKCGYVKK